MNESFDELNLSTSTVLEFIDKVKLLQNNLTASNERLAAVWIGSSFDNLTTAINLEQDKLKELQDYLVKVMKVIELVNEHNVKRRQRIATEAEISRLYGRLNYEEWDENLGEMVTHERPGVRESIVIKEGEVVALNQRLDQIVSEIDAATVV